MSIDRRVKRSARDGFALRAWTGTPSDVSRIVDLAQTITDDARRRALEGFDDSLGDRDAFMEEKSWMRSEDERTEAWQTHVRYAEEHRVGDLVVMMEARQRKFSRKIEGSPADVLSEIDLEDVLALRIGVGSTYVGYRTSGFGLDVSFERKEGVQVKAVGPDSDWVLLATSKLRDALRPARPWYSFLLIPQLVGPVASISFVGVFGYWAISQFDSGDAAALIALSLGVSFLVGYGAMSVMRRIVPAFELLAEGTRARGARILSVTGTLAVWIASTIVLPILIAQGAA